MSCEWRRLWPKAEVRPVLFHDVPHMTAGLLMMAGVTPAAVPQRAAAGAEAAPSAASLLRAAEAEKGRAGTPGTNAQGIPAP